MAVITVLVLIRPNWFAYAALLIWPVVTLYFYSRRPIGQATLWTILGAYLLLPVGTEFKFDMVPAFDKHTIPNLAALLGCALFARRLPKFFRGFGLTDILIFVVLIGPIITSMLNTDPIRIGATVLPGAGLWEGLSASGTQFLFMLPYFFGRQFLRSLEDNVEILKVMTIAGLAYSLLMLFEVRMSPQLHTWIYGYFPADFSQQVRDGGFRPVVFLGHGLLVAFFGMTTAVAASALWRTQTRIGRLAPGFVTAYLSLVLVLCKTFSAIAYGAVLVPLVRWASPRLQLRIACTLVILTLTYPMSRVADLVPTNSILEVANAVSPDRATSLETRFVQEQSLLDRALERPWFGWGRFGRNRIYDTGGTNLSITDGEWIIVLGTFGLVGFIAEFALLGLPVFRAAMALRFVRSAPESVFLATLALIVAISMIDLLPNSSISPWTWLLAGALLGRAEEIHARARQRMPQGERYSPSIRFQGSRSSLT